MFSDVFLGSGKSANKDNQKAIFLYFPAQAQPLQAPKEPRLMWESEVLTYCSSFCQRQQNKCKHVHTCSCNLRQKWSRARAIANALRRRDQASASATQPVPDVWKTHFSYLEEIAKSPVARTLLDRGLRQKNADVSFFSKLAAACVQEGSSKFQTQFLAGTDRESRLHRRLARDLPHIRTVSLTTLHKKTTVQRKVSNLQTILRRVHFAPCACVA